MFSVKKKNEKIKPNITRHTFLPPPWKCKKGRKKKNYRITRHFCAIRCTMPRVRNRRHAGVSVNFFLYFFLQWGFFRTVGGKSWLILIAMFVEYVIRQLHASSQPAICHAVLQLTSRCGCIRVGSYWLSIIVYCSVMYEAKNIIIIFRERWRSAGFGLKKKF